MPGDLTVGTANVSSKVQLALHTTTYSMPPTNRLGALVFNPQDGKLYCYTTGPTGDTGWGGLQAQF